MRDSGSAREITMKDYSAGQPQRVRDYDEELQQAGDDVSGREFGANKVRKARNAAVE